MGKPSVFVTRRWPNAVESRLSETYDTTFNRQDRALTPTELKEALIKYDAILPTVTYSLNAEVLDVASPKTRFLGNFGVGYSHICEESARALGLTVTNTPGVLSECTADLTIMLMLMVARRAGEGERELRSGKWSGWAPTHMVGTKVSALQRVYEHRLRLNPGALQLLAYARWDGLKILLISGGFTYFTDRLKPRLGLDFSRSNQLEIENDRLTGRVIGPVIDQHAKRDTVAEVCRQIGCEHAQVIAVGDGANDLEMMKLAGLSVAYRAKPKVREFANVNIDSGGLDRLLTVTVPSVVYRHG